MANGKRYISSTLWAVALSVLILDAKTAMGAASDAIALCIEVLIPSLFPFFVISIMLTGCLRGMKIPILRPLGKLLRLPEGGESIFLIGLLGGYPVGAATVCQYIRSGELRPQDGKRLLAFCSNAGPSFMFGVGMQIFTDMRYCWIAWAIHIISAIAVGVLTPGRSQHCEVGKQQKQKLQAALKKSLGVLASVCGWVVLFRILLAFLQRWFLWHLSIDQQVLLQGIIELANGSCALPQIENPGERLIIFSTILAFGGLCVWMQTGAVTEGTDASWYLPGKITQTCISIMLASVAQIFLPATQRSSVHWAILLICAVVCTIYAIILRKSENKSGNSALIGV